VVDDLLDGIREDLLDGLPEGGTTHFLFIHTNESLQQGLFALHFPSGVTHLQDLIFLDLHLFFALHQFLVQMLLSSQSDFL